MDDQAIHVALMEHALVKLDILEANVSPAKVITTKLKINVKLAIVIAMEDQAFHVALTEYALVILDILEANVSLAKRVITKEVINVTVSKYPYLKSHYYV